MPVVRHSNDPCAHFRAIGHPCPGGLSQESLSSSHNQLLPSIYQAALSHSGDAFGHHHPLQHTPWEAVTFVAVSAIVLVAYIAVLGYLATRALKQVPSGSAPITGPDGLTSTRIVYDVKTDICQPPLPAEMIDPPKGSIDV